MSGKVEVLGYISFCNEVVMRHSCDVKHVRTTPFPQIRIG